MEVRIYFEGDPKLRPGFQAFFSQFQGSEIRINAIGCGANVVEGFMNGIKRNPESLNVMLKDAESPDERQTLIGQVRQDDHWNDTVAGGVADDQIHFMVEIMESWFLADRDALRDFYGPRLLLNRLPGNPHVEEIPKADVDDGLRAATAGTSKGRYHKTKHAPTLLANINPSMVRNAAPNCKRLFDYLHSLASSST